MINKEIKTKAQAVRVAKTLEEDLNATIGFFDGYKVENEKDEDEVRVQITSKTCCKILTDSVMGYIFSIANTYSVLYKCISYRIDYIRNEECPAFVFVVKWDK